MRVSNLMIGLQALCTGRARAFIRYSSPGAESSASIAAKAKGKFFTGYTTDTTFSLRGERRFGKTRGKATVATRERKWNVATRVNNDVTISKKRLATYLCIWYLAGSAFNVISAEVVPALGIPLTVTAAYTAVGNAIAVPILSSRKLRATSSSRPALKKFFIVAALLAIANATSQKCAQEGALDPWLLAKATEPLVTAVLRDVSLGKVSSLQTYASLLPIVIGVGLVPATAPGFDRMALGVSIASMISSALAITLAKNQLLVVNDISDPREKISPAEVNAALTISGTALLLPSAIMLERTKIKSLLLAASTSTPSIKKQMLTNAIFGGLSFYLCSVSSTAHVIASNMSAFFMEAVLVIAYRISETSVVSVIGAVMSSVGITLFNHESCDSSSSSDPVQGTSASERLSTGKRRCEKVPPSASRQNRGRAPQDARASVERATRAGWMGWTRAPRASDGITPRGGLTAKGRVAER